MSIDLNPLQGRMVACSLSIDGRPDMAAQAVITGHVTEFQYMNGAPHSPKAKQLVTLQGQLEALIQEARLPQVISDLRSLQGAGNNQA